MSTKWESYQRDGDQPPSMQPGWLLHGAGLENFGADGGPEQVEVPSPGPGEILARVDAASVCASDAKMVRLGPEYPLFRGRDLAADPPRLGHELALTVVSSGDGVDSDYAPGTRLALQPDVIADEGRTPVGVLLPGGFTRYMLLDERVLSQVHGPFAYPVEGLDYASVAVSEPWACVERSYRDSRRVYPKTGGRMLLRQGGEHASRGRRQPYRLALESAPAQIDLDGDFDEQTGLVSDAERIAESVRRLGKEGDWTESTPCLYDDIILLEPTAGEIADSFSLLAPGGLLCVCRSEGPIEAEIPLGRIHYESIGIVGTGEDDIGQAYATENRTELADGGALWVAGAGGPMGQMHLLRALQSDGGPSVIVATNRGADRVARLKELFEPVASNAGKQLIVFSPRESGTSARGMLASKTDRTRFTDVVVVAASAELIREALEAVEAGGTVSLFGGLPPSTFVPVRLDAVVHGGANLVGTSGSSVSDQKRILAAAAGSRLRANLVVDAVCGIEAIGDAVRAVSEKRFAGKVVSYPHLEGLPLLSVAELAALHSDIRQALNAGGGWSSDVERLLFEHYLIPRTVTGKSAR